MSADTDAIAATRCPDCGAPVGDPCVYLAPRAYAAHVPEKQARGWMSRRRQAERAGQPTSRVHQGRYAAARDIQIRAARQAMRERGYPVRSMSSALRHDVPSADRYPEPLATYLTAVAFDEHGYKRLREWLAEHGSILQGGDRG